MSDTARMSGPGRVLVVDDHAQARESMADILRQAGHQARCCSSAVEALQLLARESFDCVITDLNMPGMNGIGLIREVRSKPESRMLPIVLLTTESQDTRKQEAKAAGATGWIVKPFTTNQLLAVVKKVIG